MVLFGLRGPGPYLLLGSTAAQKTHEAAKQKMTAAIIPIADGIIWPQHGFERAF